MANNINTSLDERLFDAMLKEAVKESVIKEVDSAPSREELDKLFPRNDTFDRRALGIVGRVDKKQKRVRAVRTLYRTAAAIALLVTASLITLMSIEASRNFILNTFISVQDDHIVFRFGRDAENLDSSFIPLESLPYGFELVSSEELNNLSTFIYINPLGEQLIAQRHAGMSLETFIDNEHREHVITTISERTVHFFKAFDTNYFNAAMWSDGLDVIQIVANIDIYRLTALVKDLIND